MKNENGTKTCKHCQSEIPQKAKVCPICRKKQGGFAKWIVLGIVGLVLISVIMGGGDNGEEPKPTDANPQSVGNVESNQETPTENKEVKNEFSVGEIIETSNLKISYISAEEYVPENDLGLLEDGNVYYKMEFEFENIGDSDEYVSSFDFNCYADGYDMERSYLDGIDLDATLSAGKKTKGAIVFQVPEDAEEITLEYEVDFWTEDKIVFIVK